MRRFIASLLSLQLTAAPAVAQDTPALPPPPPEILSLDTPRYTCSVTRAGALGEVEVFQFVFPNGNRTEPTYSLTVQPDPAGIRLTAVWGDPGPYDHSFVQIDYVPADRDDVYRIEIRREEPSESNQLRFQSGFLRPESGAIHVFTGWGPLTRMLDGATDPAAVVLDGEGTVVQRDPIDPAAFAQAVALGASLRPELDAMVADYRNRCPFFGGGHVAAGAGAQVPG